MTDDLNDQQDAATPPGLVERLVAECLQDAGRFSMEVIDKACEENPADAAEIRERFRAIAAAGLLGPVSRFAFQDKAPDTADKSTDTLGPYRLLEELGRGGQAMVHLAEDTRLGRRVALKILTGLGPLSETAMRRFKREAEVASRLDHPGICAVYDAGIEQGTPYIAMQHVDGTTLAERIDTTRSEKGSTTGSTTRSEVQELVNLVEKAARALHAAHEAGIVHRDVKPGNIMVTPGGDPVLLDFGLAAGEDSGLVTLTATEDRPGTLAYMSPEQLMDRPVRLDRRTDVYSLGVTLYEGLTLRRPFRAETREAMYQAIQYETPENPRRFNPHLSRDLKAVLDTALEKDRNRRYQTALDLAEDLRRVREMEPVAARPPGAVGRTLRWARRRPVRAALVVVAILGIPLITGLGGYILANLPDIQAQRRQAILDRVEGYLEAGYDEVCHGSPARALDAFDAALRLEADCVEAVAGKALALLEMDRAQQCLEVLDGQGEPALEGIRAEALRKLGRPDEAAEAEKRVPEPATSQDFFLAGSCLMVGCEHQKETAVFRRALDCFTRAAFTAPAPRLIYQLQLAHAAGHCGDEAWCRRMARALTLNWKDSSRAKRWAKFALEQIAPGGTPAPPVPKR